MKTPSLLLASFCISLSACNSQPAEEPAATTQAPASAAPVSSPTMNSPVAAGPAPEGLPSRVAREVIGTSGQRCESVTQADRGADGSISATCSGGESYRIQTVPGRGAVATPSQQSAGGESQ